MITQSRRWTLSLSGRSLRIAPLLAFASVIGACAERSDSAGAWEWETDTDTDTDADTDSDTDTDADTDTVCIGVYSADFDAGMPSEFSGPGDTAGGQGWNGLGSGDFVFAENMLRSTSAPPEPIRLDLDGLPSHTRIRVAFLLAIIDSWDGLDDASGPDWFNVTVDDLSVFSHVFNATSGTSDYTPPAGGLLSSGSDLGFSSGDWMENDQAYDMSLEPAFDSIVHSASSVTIEFFASGQWEGGDNESWAIDALCVSVSK